MSKMQAFQFLTWRTYGTWVPGDERGWHRRRQGEQDPSLPFERHVRSRMDRPMFVMNPAQREACLDAFLRLGRRRNWAVYAVNVRTNHVHMAIGAAADPWDVIRNMKSEATNAMQSALLIAKGDRVWAKGGWCGFRRRVDRRLAILEYVIERQGENSPGTIYIAPDL